MALRRVAWLSLVGLLAWIPVGIGPPGAAPPVEETRVADAEASRWLQAALATQAATRARLRVADGPTCAEAGLVSYRRSDVQRGVSDQWYVASQLWADAQLLRVAQSRVGATVRGVVLASSRHSASADWDEPDARCHLDKGFSFLDRLWDPESGGYYPRSSPFGLEVVRGVHYADDNALAGLALLAAAESDPPMRERYLRSARAQADFLARSGLWDGTFGGGFWWNTNRGDRYEGKPAQANAMAALFFGRLYEATGDEAYRELALRTLDWLDAVLYDPARQLYRWSIHYEAPSRRAGVPTLSGRYFNYDQGIAIEAQLLAARLDGAPDHARRARDIGRALHAAFWGQERGGYNLEVGVERLHTSYAAWASLGHLALYDLDGDGGWLDMARANADALAATMLEADGGYAYRHFRCLDRTRPGCESGAAWVLDRTRDGVAQAWMQHLQAALAQRIAAPR